MASVFAPQACSNLLVHGNASWITLSCRAGAVTVSSLTCAPAHTTHMCRVRSFVAAEIRQTLDLLRQQYLWGLYNTLSVSGGANVRGGNDKWASRAAHLRPLPLITMPLPCLQPPTISMFLCVAQLYNMYDITDPAQRLQKRQLASSLIQTLTTEEAVYIGAAFYPTRQVIGALPSNTIGARALHALCLCAADMAWCRPPPIRLALAMELLALTGMPAFYIIHTGLQQLLELLGCCEPEAQLAGLRPRHACKRCP